MLCLEYFDREIKRVQDRYCEVLQQSLTHNTTDNILIFYTILSLSLIQKEILNSETEEEQQELVKEFVRRVIAVKKALNRLDQEYKKKGGKKQRTETEMRKAA